MDPVITPLAMLIAAWLADRAESEPQLDLFETQDIQTATGAWVNQLLGTSDQVVVYRTSRSRAEGARVAQFIREGRPSVAFRASSHITPGIANHGQLDARFRTAKRRGQVPLFATPYVTAAWFYRAYPGSLPHDEYDPVTWAMVLPRSSVIWENPRVQRTQGIAYSLLYPDSEVIVDATAITEVRWVPDELVETIGQAAKAIGKDLIASGGFKNAYKDRDPILAAAMLDSVLALEVPRASIGRPFLEVPFQLPHGAVMKGQKVLLIDGQTARLTGASANRKEDPGDGGLRWATVELSELQGRVEEAEDAGVRLRLSASGYTDWTGTLGPLNKLNLSWHMIERPLAKGERVSQKQRLAIWHANRGLLEDMVAEIVELDLKFRDQARARGDTRIAENLQERLEDDQAVLVLTREAFPPWA